jgi:hypothetical protein
MSDNDKPLKLEWTKSPNGVFEIYTNSTHLTWTVDDIRIRLGQMVESRESQTPGPGFKGSIQERAAVTFSWRGAKMLRNQLDAIIDSYESVNGSIKIDLTLPPSV